MNVPRLNLRLHAAALLFCTSLLAAGQAPAPDNSRANRGNSDKGAVTAEKQKTNASDQDITKQIRSSVVKDKSLSTYGHNVKIVTQDGKVTLKGPVRSEEEKNNLGAKAAAVVGESNVTNEITVAPSK